MLKFCRSTDFGIEVDGVSYDYKKGDTVLIPAMLTKYNMEGEASILEIYIS